jgi:endonuclease/exonuclease/phosphatase family metal-dependent hydrolase
VSTVDLGFLSYNAGLLRIGWRYEPVAHIAPRLAVIPAVIEATEADVVALQEVYEDAQRAAIHDRLRHTLPHRAYVRGGRFRFDSGLMTLSRHPHESRLVRFTRGAFSERLFAWKSVLVSTLDVTGFGAVTVLNLHATAGGLVTPPDHPAVQVERDHQIRQILDLASRAPGLAVILGDFNAGPGVADRNYRALLDAGWVDVFGRLFPDSVEPTWDPRNDLNATGIHSALPPQRIDHVFVRARDIDAGRVTPLDARVVFTDACVSLANGARVTPSDHYGMLTRLRLRAG